MRAVSAQADLRSSLQGKFAQRLQDKADKEHAEEEKKKTGSMEPATAEELDQSKGKGP